jgi:hypothetical protein
VETLLPKQLRQHLVVLVHNESVASHPMGVRPTTRHQGGMGSQGRRRRAGNRIEAYPSSAEAIQSGRPGSLIAKGPYTVRPSRVQTHQQHVAQRARFSAPAAASHQWPQQGSQDQKLGQHATPTRMEEPHLLKRSQKGRGKATDHSRGYSPGCQELAPIAYT